jgi:hypothetical protein
VVNDGHADCAVGVVCAVVVVMKRLSQEGEEKKTNEDEREALEHD